MLAYIIALKLTLERKNKDVSDIVKSLGYEGLQKLTLGEWDGLNQIIGIQAELLRSTIEDNLEKAKKIIETSSKNNIKILTILDENYPENLKLLSNCPPVLYVKGRVDKSYEKAIGCVGTRNPSIHAIRAIESLVPEWTKEGFVIVSGLAEGVDTACHKICLENDGTTIAVLANGLDKTYPKENVKLAEAIVESGGLLVSEYAIGEPIRKYNFVHRNEWICGLSKGLVIFEAGLKSGTMHSAEYAIQQEKVIFCPTPVDFEIPNVEGIKYLLDSNKAITIKNKKDYVNLINTLGYPLSPSAQKEHMKEVAYEDMRKHFGSMQFYRASSIPMKKIQINMDAKLYEEVESLAKTRGLTVQEAFETFMLAVPRAK